MTTITITPAGPNGFRAVAGGVESSGDAFFPDTARQRLADLMARWRAARDAGGNLPPAEQAELDALTAAELRAATARVAALQQTILPQGGSSRLCGADPPARAGSGCHFRRVGAAEPA